MSNPKPPIGGGFDLRTLELPKHEVEGNGGKVGSREVEGFFGMLQVRDGRNTDHNREYFAAYHCLRCKKNGMQRLTYQKKKFPDGLTDRQIESAMRERVGQNHRCGAEVIH